MDLKGLFILNVILQSEKWATLCCQQGLRAATRLSVTLGVDNILAKGQIVLMHNQCGCIWRLAGRYHYSLDEELIGKDSSWIP